MREVFVPAFEAATGARVSLFPGWWDGIPKLKAAPPDQPPFDLMISDATQGFPAAREGLFAQLSLDNIPNHKTLTPAAIDHWVFKERYGITYPDSVMTLAFHKGRVPDPPRRWADLLRPDIAGKIGLYNAYYMSLFTFACIRADADGKPGTAHDLLRTDLDGVLRFARENRRRVKLWWPTSTDMILALANGDCAAGNMHSPEYLQALREKSELGAAVPDQDRAFVQVFWAVPCRNASRKDLAEKSNRRYLLGGNATRVRPKGIGHSGSGSRCPDGDRRSVLETTLSAHPGAVCRIAILSVRPLCRTEFAHRRHLGPNRPPRRLRCRRGSRSAVSRSGYGAAPDRPGSCHSPLGRGAFSPSSVRPGVERPLS
jgi:hypothetical protein